MARISTYSTETPVTGDLVIGTDVGASDATKNFKVEDIAALAGTGGLVNLEQVLTAGNTAANDIILTGNISTTGNISLTGTLSANGGVGTAGQVLSSQGAGLPAQWVDHSTLGPNLSEVLAVGNTATNDIILTGNISLTGTLSANGGVGTAGQVLSSQGAGLPAQWIDHSTLGPNLSEVLAVGNTATNNIILNGNITQNTGNHLLSVGNMTVLAGYLSLGGILKDGTASDGTAGQVLTSTGTATLWVDQSTIVGAVPTLQDVLGAGNTANDIGISFTGTGSTTFAAAQTINSLAPNIWGATNSFTSNGTTIGTAGINLSGSLSDGTDTGTAGQTLQSTNTGVSWVDGQQQATTAISSSQILALTGTPVTVVAGVAGKHIVPHQVVVKYTFGTVAYTTTNVGALYLGSASSNSIAAIFDSSIITGGSTKTFLNSPNPSATLGADYTPEYATSTGGDPLLFGWATLNPTGGDGTLDVTVIYTLIDA